MLGTRTLEDLGLDVGDTVRISVGSRSAQLRIVGRGVLPDGNYRLLLPADSMSDLAGNPNADYALDFFSLTR